MLLSLLDAPMERKLEEHVHGHQNSSNGQEIKSTVQLVKKYKAVRDSSSARKKAKLCNLI